MRVLTPDGYKDVTTLNVGDELIGANNEINELVALNQMTYSRSKMFWRYTINDGVDLFQEQLILVAQGALAGWQMRHAKELKVGDYIFGDDNSLIEVKTIKKHRAKEWWHFKVSGDHTFIADGVILHNASITMGATGGILTTAGNWVGGVAPGAGDDALITASTGASATSLSGANWSVHGVDFTGYTGTFTNVGTRTWTIGGVTTLTTAANFKLGSGMTFTGGGTLTMQLDNRSGGLTVTSNGKTMNGITTYNNDANVAASATITYADTANIGAAGATIRRGGMTLTSGTSFSTNSTFSYTGAAGTFTLTYSGATISCGTGAFSAAGTLTLTGNSTSVITCVLANTTHFTGASGLSFPGTVNIAPSSSNTTGIFQPSSCTFSKLTFTGFAAKNQVLQWNSPCTVTGVFTSTGAASNQRLMHINNIYGTQRTITVTGATFSVTDTDFQDMNFSGGTVTGTRIGDCQGNSGVTFDTPKTNYYVATASTGNWTDQNWSNSSGGTTNTIYYPLAQDTAVFNGSSFFSAGDLTLTIDGLSISNIDAHLATAHTLTLKPTSSNKFFGSNYQMPSNGSVTWNVAAVIVSQYRGTVSWTSNGCTYTGMSGGTCFNIQNIGGTMQFQDDFIANVNNTLASMLLTNGTLNPLGNLTVPFIADAGAATRAFVGSANKTLTVVTSGTVLSFNSNTTITSNGMNIAISNTSASTKTVNFPDNTSWGNVILAGGTGTIIMAKSQALAGTITLGNVTVTTPPTTIQWYYISTFGGWVVANLPSGSGANKVTMQSVATPNAWKVTSTSGGYLAINNVSLQDSTAGTGNPYFAGSNSTNVSGNTGWNFTDPYEGLPTAPKVVSINQSINRASTF